MNKIRAFFFVYMFLVCTIQMYAAIKEPKTTEEYRQIVRANANKPYIIEFHMTMCGACKNAIPHVEEISRRYPSIDIIKVEQAAPFFNDASVGLTVTGFPTFFIFSADRSQVKSFVGFPGVETFVKEIDSIAKPESVPTAVASAPAPTPVAASKPKAKKAKSQPQQPCVAPECPEKSLPAASKSTKKVAGGFMLGKVNVYGGAPSFDEALKQHSAVLVDFYTTWCGPCKTLAADLESIASAESNVLILKVDAERYPQLAQRYGVASYPHVVFIKNGNIVSSEKGYRGKQHIINKIQSCFK